MKKILMTLSAVLSCIAAETQIRSSVEQVFSYTYEGVTLYYVIDSQNNASVVAPLNHDIHYLNENKTDGESWLGYSKPQGAVIVPETVPYGGSDHTVTTIGIWAFLHCDSITSVTLPATINSLGSHCFRECSRLKSVNIPEGINRIPNSAFYKCTDLQSVTTPSTLTSIMDGAFYLCINLRSVVLNEGLRSIGNSVFERCKNLETINFPSTLTAIGETCFGENTALTTITIPVSVETIPQYTFYFSGLKTVTLNEGLRSIDYAAFFECRKLSRINLPSTLDSIGDKVFMRCSSLDSLIVRCSTPPALGKEVFSAYTAKLIVPAGSIDAYRSHEVWGLFTDITEESGVVINETTGIRPVLNSSFTIHDDAIYDLKGHRLSNKPSATGIYIQGNKKIYIEL